MVTLYSTGCPRCDILKKKLYDKKIPFVLVTDKDVMLSMNLTQVPVLEVDGELMEYRDAVGWVNNYEGK